MGVDFYSGITIWKKLLPRGRQPSGEDNPANLGMTLEVVSLAKPAKMRYSLKTHLF